MSERPRHGKGQDGKPETLKRQDIDKGPGDKIQVINKVENMVKAKMGYIDNSLANIIQLSHKIFDFFW